VERVTGIEPAPPAWKAGVARRRARAEVVDQDQQPTRGAAADHRDFAHTRTGDRRPLPPVSWWKSNTSRGDPPWWVRVELDRGGKVEHRSRGELLVHELASDVGHGGYEHRTGGLEVPEIFIHPGGRVIAVDGRPVR
jgi:hypothetical protein